MYRPSGRLFVRLAAVLAFALLLFPVAALAAPGTQFAEIVEVVDKYLVGTADGNPELVTEAFLPSLEVQYLGDDDELRRRTAADYIARIEPGRAVPREGRIVAIDATAKSAMVKVEIAWAGRLYTDYMLLLKVEGSWRITNKIATWTDL